MVQVNAAIVISGYNTVSNRWAGTIAEANSAAVVVGTVSGYVTVGNCWIGTFAEDCATGICIGVRLIPIIRLKSLSRCEAISYS